jgi:hypothetical protein
MERCAYCGEYLIEQDYRQRYLLHLASEEHGSVVITERDIVISLHAKCCIALGVDMIKDGQNLINPALIQEEHRKNLGFYLGNLANT